MPIKKSLINLEKLIEQEINKIEYENIELRKEKNILYNAIQAIKQKTDKPSDLVIVRRIKEIIENALSRVK